MRLSRRQLRKVILKEMRILAEQAGSKLPDNIAKKIRDEVGDRGFSSFETAIESEQEDNPDSDVMALAMKVAKTHFDEPERSNVIKILGG